MVSFPFEACHRQLKIFNNRCHCWLGTCQPTRRRWFHLGCLLYQDRTLLDHLIDVAGLGAKKSRQPYFWVTIESQTVCRKGWSSYRCKGSAAAPLSGLTIPSCAICFSRAPNIYVDPAPFPLLRQGEFAALQPIRQSRYSSCDRFCH